VQGWSGPIDLEASKVDGSYADHNNKITVAGCARDWACDSSASPQCEVGLDLGAHCMYKLGARKVAAARSSEVQAWVTERSQASSPGTVRLLVQTALSLQMLASKIV
jgi:hypothetical protein